MSKLFILFISIIFLLLAVLITHLFLLKQQKKDDVTQETKKNTEGAPRYIYSLLYILVLWSLLAFWFPMLITYQQKLTGAVNSNAVLMVMAKLLILPCIFLLLFVFGWRRGYLQWIKNIHWPDNDH